MKKTIILLLLTLVVSTFTHAQNDEHNDISDLLEKRQYLTAINKINSEQSERDTPQLIDIKVQAVIEGFVQSLNHKIFAFKDLEPNEDIYELRRNGGEFNMVVGDLKEEVEEYIIKYPDSYYVYKAAGDYYADVLLRYRDQLEEYDYIDLYKLITANYEKSYSLGFTDISVISSIGEYNLRMGNYDKCAKFYELSLEEDPRNASYNYNLSIAYQNLSNYEKAMIHSQIAIEEYENADYRADSYNINAFQNRKLNRIDVAIELYIQALQLNPDLFYSQTDLVDLFLQKKDFENARTNFRNFFIRNINDFNKLQNLLKIYFKYEEVDRVHTILTNLIESSDNNINIGTLYYHLGLIDNSIGNNAIPNLTNAKEYYLKELNEEEGIIKHIDNFIRDIDS